MDRQREFQRQKVKTLYPFLASLSIHILCLLLLSSIFFYEIKQKYIVILANIESDNSIINNDPIEIGYQSDNSKDTNLESEVTYIGLTESATKVEIEYSELLSTKSDIRPEYNNIDLVSIVGNSSMDSDGFDGLSKNRSVIEQRLIEHGAGTGDVQVSISWENYNDIDLWIVVGDYDSGIPICWMNRTYNGGTLDIDQNVYPTTNKAIENVYWPTGCAPYGRYTVYIDYYKKWDKKSNTEVTIRILVDGSVSIKKVNIRPDSAKIRAYSFVRKPSKHNHINNPIMTPQRIIPTQTNKIEADPYAELVKQLLPDPISQ